MSYGRQFPADLCPVSCSHKLAVFYGVYCCNVGSQDQEVSNLDGSEVLGSHHTTHPGPLRRQVSAVCTMKCEKKWQNWYLPLDLVGCEVCNFMRKYNLLFPIYTASLEHIFQVFLSQKETWALEPSGARLYSTSSVLLACVGFLQDR